MTRAPGSPEKHGLKAARSGGVPHPSRFAPIGPESAEVEDPNGKAGDGGSECGDQQRQGAVRVLESGQHSHRVGEEEELQGD